MSIKRPNIGMRVQNLSKPASINKEQAKSISNREIDMASVVLDYDVVVKRFSTAKSGLMKGSPPGFVGP